ncbi:hypothetical protein QBC42DRAFT_265974 [Cladorrhinum samala]|uniref:Uncharacterized protein n=1 Tax=Cladorrhinum samala TaxID=585594 RepID=A0AAV9HRB8_9PEZI|nr:hypothetical protein QBC42DRAFT_265974 [Cladorrhinum samala]
MSGRSFSTIISCMRTTTCLCISETTTARKFAQLHFFNFFNFFTFSFFMTCLSHCPAPNFSNHYYSSIPRT